MTKAQLVDRIAASADVSKQDAEKIVSSVFAAISKALQDGERLDIRGFGSFRARDRKARQARNPRTGETIQVPAQKVACIQTQQGISSTAEPFHWHRWFGVGLRPDRKAVWGREPLFPDSRLDATLPVQEH